MPVRQHLTLLGSSPSVNKEFHGLRTITRRWKIQGQALKAANVEAEVFLAYGTADDEFPNALLIDRRVEPIGGGASALDQSLVEVYQEFTAGMKVAVGSDVVSRDENNRKTLVRQYVVLASEAEGLAAATGVNGDTGFVCSGSRVERQGVGATLTESYVEATAEWVQVGPDKADIELNGLRRVRQLHVAKAGTPAPSYVVGTTAGPSGTFLASYTDANSDVAVSRIEVTFLQPGVVSKSESPGPVPGTVEHAWSCFRVDPTNATDMTDLGGVMPGVLVGKANENVQGYLMRRFSTIAAVGGGSITGVKATYRDVTEVRVPGTVQLTNVSVTVGGVTGDIPVVNHTPPRTKQVACTVTVEVTTTPPATGTLAYDLGSISCSVISTQASHRITGVDRWETLSGGIRYTSQRKDMSIGADISVFPNCYLLPTTTVEGMPIYTVTGDFAFTAAQYPNDPNSNTLVMNNLTSSIRRTLSGTGSTAADGYVTTGIIQRSPPRAIITALDGTVYWEIKTWSV